MVGIGVRPRDLPGRGSGLAVADPMALALVGDVFGLELDRESEAALVEGRAGHGLPAGSHEPSPELLLALYRLEGPEFVHRLRGAFVIAVADAEGVTLFRDGAGARTVYHGRGAGRTVFAIEPKGVLADSTFERRLRPAALAQYLSFSFVPGEGTMLEDLFEVPAGHWVRLGPGGPVEIRRWFVFEEGEPSSDALRQVDFDTWVPRMRAELARAVDERLDATVGRGPIGVFLSGGLDSSLVTAELARRRGSEVKSFAIHFGDRYPNELEFARAVAERCGTDHREVLVRPEDFLPRLREMVWNLDEPVGDPVTIGNYELSAHVGRELSTVFNGEGGDPLFGGPKNLPMLLGHWYGGSREPGFRERAYLASYRRAYEEVSRLLSPDWRERIDPGRDLEGVLTPFFETGRPVAFLNKLMAINVRLKGAHLILPKVERMTAAHGILPLSPLFDEGVLRLAFAMPPGLKLHRGSEKAILKEAWRHELPAAVVDRPKSGMRVPVHYWFQGELRRYARKVFSKREVVRAGVLDPGRVKTLLDYGIEEGRGRHGIRLWMLLTLETWRRLVLDGDTG